MASPVPAEDEFVEVALDMGLAQSVEDALGPSLEVREHAVDPFQQLIPTALDIDRCPVSGHDRGYRCRVVREEVPGCGALVEDFIPHSPSNLLISLSLQWYFLYKS